MKKDLKRIVTIFLLLLMTVQTGGLYYTQSVPLDSAAQAHDDQIDCGSNEEKKEGYAGGSRLPSFQLFWLFKVQPESFGLIIITSPIRAHLAPPPDCTFGC